MAVRHVCTGGCGNQETGTQKLNLRTSGGNTELGTSLHYGDLLIDRRRMYFFYCA